MSNQTSIARPYAKAAFHHALESNQLLAWSTWLQTLKQVVAHPMFHALINNPTITQEQLAEFTIAMAHDLKMTCSAMQSNFIRLLAKNKRLSVLPAIAFQFDALRAEQERTLTVNVTSFAPLTTAQQQQLIDSLSRRLQRQVTLQENVDASLLGGVVIRANNLVIDGSVKGQLIKLGADLAA
jgi:F-type H+-transporting ATPase subunit delta